MDHHGESVPKQFLLFLDFFFFRLNLVILSETKNLTKPSHRHLGHRCLPWAQHDKLVRTLLGVIEVFTLHGKVPVVLNHGGTYGALEVCAKSVTSYSPMVAGGWPFRCPLGKRG